MCVRTREHEAGPSAHSMCEYGNWRLKQPSDASAFAHPSFLYGNSMTRPMGVSVLHGDDMVVLPVVLPEWLLWFTMCR